MPTLQKQIFLGSPPMHIPLPRSMQPYLYSPCPICFSYPPCPLPIGVPFPLSTSVDQLLAILTNFSLSPNVRSALEPLLPLLTEWLTAIMVAPSSFQLLVYPYSQWSPIILELTPGTSLSPCCALALKGLHLLKDVLALLLHVDYLLAHFSPNLARRFLQYLHTVANGIRATPYLVEPCVLSTCIPGIFYLRPPTIQAWLKTHGLRLFCTPPLAPSYATYVWISIDPATLPRSP